MATRELTGADLTRSSKNGEGSDPRPKTRALKGIGRPTRGNSRAVEKAKKNAILPGKQVRNETDKWFGYLQPIDERRRGLGQDEDTIAAIKAIRDMDAQASHATWNFLRLINPGHDIKAYVYRTDGSEELEEGLGQVALDEWATRVGGEYGGGTDSLHNVLALVLLTNGALALEVEVTARMNDVVDWHPVDPLLLSYRRLKGEDGANHLYLGQDEGTTWRQLNEATVFYQPLDPDIDDPYGRPPMLAAVQNVLFLSQLHADVRAMAHQQGFPRLDVSVVWDAIKAAAPMQLQDDTAAFQEWATVQLNSIVSDYEDLAADDTFIHYDFVKVGSAGGGAGSFDFPSLDKILTRRVTMSLKALPITLGINDSVSETHGSIQWQIQVAGIENFQKVIKRILEKAANVSLRIKGIQCHAKVEYQEIRTIDRLYEAQSDFFDRRNAQFDVQMGWETNTAAAERILGHAAVSDPLIDLGGGAADEGGGGAFGGDGEDDKEWWEGVVNGPESGDNAGPGQGSGSEKKLPTDLPGFTANMDPQAAWKLMFIDEKKRAASGQREFPQAREALGDPDDPLDDCASYAEAGQAAFEELRREVLEVLVAEGLLQRDTATDVSAYLKRSLARQMKGLLRSAIVDGITLAAIGDLAAPRSLVDRIWRRNQPYVDRITNDLAEAIRRGDILSAEDLAEWFEKNSYRERLMGRHLGKQGLNAGFAYALGTTEGTAFRWTRTINESCDSCVGRGGNVFTFEELQSLGFPGADTLDCGANCRCILVPVEGRHPDVQTRHYPGGQDHDQTKHAHRTGPQDHLNAGLQKFAQAGGLVEDLQLREMDIPAFKKLTGDVRDKITEVSKYDETKRQYDGGKFTYSSYFDQETIAATAPGGMPAGALGWHFDAGNPLEDSYPAIFIDHLGTSGVIPGTGSALVAHVLRKAADNGWGIALESIDDARGWWGGRLQMRENGEVAGLMTYELDPATTAGLAAKLYP